MASDMADLKKLRDDQRGLCEDAGVLGDFISFDEYGQEDRVSVHSGQLLHSLKAAAEQEGAE